MSTMNVFVGNLQLPPFPAGQPASEVYKTLKDAYGGGILVGPNGVGILNNSSLVPAGNYTYVPAAAVVPRVGVAPYATARVGPYATFTYASAPGVPPQVSGVPPIVTGVTSQSTAGVVAAIATGVPTLERLAPHAAAAVGGSNETGGLAILDRVSPYGATGVTPNATNARIAPLAATRSASANPKIAARESQVPQNVEAPPQQAYRRVVVQEQKAENSSPVSNPTTGSGPSRTTVAARGKLPDWSPQELKKLILAKKQEWEHATCGTPLQKKMASGKEKWKIIAENLVNEGMKNPVRDHSSCKKKWEKVTGEFKKVYDYERMVCNAEESYYAMSASDRRRKNLPSNFSEEVYEMIADWLPSRHDPDPSALHVMDSSTRSLDDEAPTSDSTPVGVAPYATARVGPYATFTYASAPGVPPQVSGVPPIVTGVTSQSTAGVVAAIATGVPPLERLAPHAAAGVGGSNETGGLVTLDRVSPYGATGVTANATNARIAPLAATRSASANPKIAARGL